MAILKKINFGGDAHEIAKTVLTSKEGGVMSVTAPINSETSQLFTNGDDEPFDYHYELDVNVDDSTIVKSGNKLAVGNVPAAQVTVDNTDAGITSTNAQAAFKELKADIDKVDSAAKSYKIIKETKETPNVTLEANVLEQYKLQQTVNGVASIEGETIKIYKDSSLKSVELVDQQLVFTYILENGSEKTVSVDVSTFLAESEFADGLQVTNHVVSVKIDPASEKFLTVGKDGVKLAGVQNAINTAVSTAVEGLDVTDTAEEGKYVSKVSETDGKIAVVRANVSDAVLNGYAKGTAPAAGTEGVTADDDVKGAIAKLEHQVDAAKAAATTKVAKDNAASHLTLESSTAADGSTTYTIGESDIASKTVLDAEIAARKAVDGQTGDTYAKNGGTNYISVATSLNDADVKLDAAIKAEETRANSAETSIDAAIGLTKGTSDETRTYANTGEYIGKKTSNTVASDIKALDTKLKEVADGLAAVQYKVNGTTLEFFGISEKKTA